MLIDPKISAHMQDGVGALVCYFLGTVMAFFGEAYLKVQAKRRHHGVRASLARMLRLMREDCPDVPTRCSTIRGPHSHDETVILAGSGSAIGNGPDRHLDHYGVYARIRENRRGVPNAWKAACGLGSATW